MAIFNLYKKFCLCQAKQTEPEDDDNKAEAEGVFVSSRTLAMMPTPPSSSVDADASEWSSATNGWRSADSPKHHANSPLIVIDSTDRNDEITIGDEVEQLGKVMARCQQLPGTSCFTSNHILVNQERTRRTVAPLTRRAELDALARQHAQDMVEHGQLHHADLKALQWALSQGYNEITTPRRLGENVARGRDVRSIHNDMMSIASNKNNIVDRRFTQFGMGTAIDEDGELYMCQIFRA